MRIVNTVEKIRSCSIQVIWL
ncbi:MAG: hypothetical protein EZS28_051054, partial [Streblomastix strix]